MVNPLQTTVTADVKIKQFLLFVIRSKVNLLLAPLEYFMWTLNALAESLDSTWKNNVWPMLHQRLRNWHIILCQRWAKCLPYKEVFWNSRSLCRAYPTSTKGSRAISCSKAMKWHWVSNLYIGELACVSVMNGVSSLYAVQSQNAISADFTNKQILYFG